MYISFQSGLHYIIILVLHHHHLNVPFPPDDVTIYSDPHTFGEIVYSDLLHTAVYCVHLEEIWVYFCDYGRVCLGVCERGLSY